MKLITATLADIDLLLPLVRAYHEFEEIVVSDEHRRQAIEPLLATDAALGRIWLVSVAERTVGYIALCLGYSIEFGGRDAFVDEFFLKESARGQGIGSEVLEAVKGEAARLAVCVLHLEVGIDNERARRLYAKAGFQARDQYHLLSCPLVSQ